MDEYVYSQTTAAMQNDCVLCIYNHLYFGAILCLS